MLSMAIEEIKACFSLPDLQDVWEENAEQWKTLPGSQAAEIIMAKNARKQLLESGRQYPITTKMKSAILGSVPVKLWPDRAEVAGVQYSHAELKDFISRNLSTESLRTIHNVKQEFDR